MATQITGYCVKCKVKDQTMEDVTFQKAKNGRDMACGVCAVCSCKMTKFVAKQVVGATSQEAPTVPQA